MEYNENPKSYYAPMHTAEHILNGTINQMFGCGRAFSAHIEKKKSKCDYYFTRNLTEEEIAAVEEKVNSVIIADMEVSESLIDRNEAEREFNLSKLPEEAGDTLRVITIGNYDKCLCSGPHVESTNVIGRFKIVSSSFENGILRVRFKITGQSL
ncbi:MAG: Threonyl/alanyl tRNA synthetase SAD [Ignavibacteria bacterium]|nr:MAG: Threonyl/alanyl tRNA synthetase SAD [Ignavibacteria bacterium]KAF0159118.1 MAG: Threonyl/alanyl tRNA synthetase SAD [Ignavibacteria bacterium]